MKICRPYITKKNGQRLYAKDLGLKAICWEVTEEQHQAYLEKKAKAKKKKEEKNTKDNIEESNDTNDKNE